MKNKNNINSMKTLLILQKLLTGIAVTLIIIGVLTKLEFIDPVGSFESAMRDGVEKKLRAEAEAGNVDAQNKLGAFLYRLAQRDLRNFSEAIEWMELASEQKHPLAQMNLAYAYKAGNGVPLDKQKAIELFYQSGISFLRTGYPLDAKDNTFNINKIDKNHPLKHKLVDAIERYQQNEQSEFSPSF